MKIAHLTTVDLSLRYLVFPQLLGSIRLGAESIGISAPGPWVEELERAGVRHIALDESTRGMNLVADLRAARQLWSILRRERLDVLHTHNPKPGIYGRILGRLAGVPIVVNTVHGLYATEDDSAVKRAVVYGLEAIASRFSHAELVQSSEDLALLRRLRISPHATLLGNGVSLSRFDPGRFDLNHRNKIRAEIGADTDSIVVGIVGRLVAEKGYPELFEAMRLLDDRYLLVCVGPDDPDKSDALPRSMVDAAAADGVQFLGMRTDVDRLYPAMDLFVLPSHREGFPRAAMEAAAMGLPIVATDIRGCREVVAPDANGLLVPVLDGAALASAIDRLGRDELLRSRMSRAARQRAFERFDEDRVVEIVLHSYQAVARAKGLDWFRPGDDTLEYRDAVRRDAAHLARLHADSISEGFLPKLGHRFLVVLYEALIEHPEAAVVVAADAVGPVGFVAGAISTGDFYRTFVKRHGLRAGWAAVPRLVRPSVLARAWETLRYGDDGGDLPESELLSMAVAARLRGQGVGSRLGAEFLDRMRTMGADEVRVVVGPATSGAIHVYRKIGFEDAASVEVHAGEVSQVLVWSP